MIGKTIKRFAVVGGLLLTFIFALSAFYYQALPLTPRAIWDGANLSVRSIFATDTQPSYGADFDAKLVKELHKSIESGELDFRNVELVQVVDVELSTSTDNEQSSDAEFRQDVRRLGETNDQLLDTKSIINSLDSDFTAFAAYQQSELARRQAIIEATEAEIERPSESEVSALMIKQSRSKNTDGVRVSPQVLDNIQKTTGISPREVNELMSR